MTAHKAHAGAIASALIAVILAILGVVPTTEEVLAADLKALFETICAFLVTVAAPWLATCYTPNKPKS